MWMPRWENMTLKLISNNCWTLRRWSWNDSQFWNENYGTRTLISKGRKSCCSAWRLKPWWKSQCCLEFDEFRGCETLVIISTGSSRLSTGICLEGRKECVARRIYLAKRHPTQIKEAPSGRARLLTRRSEAQAQPNETSLSYSRTVGKYVRERRCIDCRVRPISHRTSANLGRLARYVITGAPWDGNSRWSCSKHSTKSQHV
jgi:hypothetical protein